MIKILIYTLIWDLKKWFSSKNPKYIRWLWKSSNGSESAGSVIGPIRTRSNSGFDNDMSLRVFIHTKYPNFIRFGLLLLVLYESKKMDFWRHSLSKIRSTAEPIPPNRFCSGLSYFHLAAYKNDFSWKNPKFTRLLRKSLYATGTVKPIAQSRFRPSKFYYLLGT